jgi:hypothetical protein
MIRKVTLGGSDEKESGSKKRRQTDEPTKIRNVSSYGEGEKESRSKKRRRTDEPKPALNRKKSKRRLTSIERLLRERSDVEEQMNYGGQI